MERDTSAETVAFRSELADNHAWPLVRIGFRFEDQLADQPGHISLAEHDEAQIGRQRALIRPAEMDFGRLAGLGEFQGDGGNRVGNRRRSD